MSERLKLLAWRLVQRGSLLGFAEVELPIGLQIKGVIVMTGRNGVWAGLPARIELDREGRAKKDANNKPVYAEILAWRSRELTDAFSRRVVELVRNAYPNDLPADAEPSE